MSRVEVWAPAAAQVEVEVEGVRFPMEPCGRGRLAADIPGLGHGARYGFRLDGGALLPDPRSGWQPEGVHAASAWVDHGRFKWRSEGFRPGELRDQVFYELHPGTFGDEPTFDGVIARLPHLLALGVTAVSLMPVAEFAGDRGWGYDGVDLFAPHHAYGGPDGLKRLVDACHAQGLAIVLDVVYNHLGAEGNYLDRFGPYFTDAYRTPWGSAFNFDGPHSDEVRRFAIDNALMWLRDYRFDGLRLDAVHAIFDRNALNVVEELTLAVRELESDLGRRAWVIAESAANDPRLVTEPGRGGYGLDSQWSDDFHHALHAALTGERSAYYQDFGNLADLAKALRQAYVIDGVYSSHRRRHYGRTPPPGPGERFFAYLQNHDQVGNRAQGDRTSHLLSPGLLKCGAALVLGAPFVPMLFMGEEWAASTPFQFFSDHRDAGIARATTEGRVREFAAFGWDPASVPDPQAVATYERSRLRWAELESEPHASVLAWHRRLIELRRRVPGLHDGRRDLVDVAFSEDERWLVLTRAGVQIAVNLASRERSVPASGAVLAASEEGVRASGEGLLVLPPESAVVLDTNPTSMVDKN